MSGDQMGQPTTGRLRTFFSDGPARWYTLAAVLIAAAVIVAFALPRGPNDPDAAASASSSPTSSAAGSPSASPSESPAPSTTASPSPPSNAGPDGPVVREPVPIDEPAEVFDGVSAAVSSLEAVDGEARGPGDVAGPSVRVTVAVTNDTATSIDLSTAVVNVTYGDDDSPASSLPGPGVEAFPGSVAAGATAVATLVFSVPIDQRAGITVTFDYSVDVPIVAFTGPAPT